MINPIILSKLALWVVTITAATMLLRRKRMDGRTRTMFLVAGVLVFGFLYGWLSPLNPNPMTSIGNLLLGVTGMPVAVPLTLSVVLVGLMLGATVVSNRSICGWGCQLGLLQDLLYRAPVPKRNVSLRVSLVTRAMFLVLLVIGAVVWGVNLLGVLNPFGVFQLQLSLVSGVVLLAVVGSSLVFYRPWCRFVCPFGLAGWAAEQFSLLKPTVDREACKDCQACVRACPSGAMKDFYDGNRVHTDCFACGACIEACQFDALDWKQP
ncbi:MAG: 4Fe-4S binding protein [Candidatus Bathyarchaeota archaeon]|nr:4Fe-4S binding protein [Candidatus Bathyarchaeota archaeon]